MDAFASTRSFYDAKSHRLVGSGFALSSCSKPAQPSSSSSFVLCSSEGSDDADVVDEGLHPLTLLTGCSTSGNVTEGVDEMVEAS